MDTDDGTPQQSDSPLTRVPAVSRSVKFRAIGVACVLSLALLGLIGRLAQMQVMQHPRYERLARRQQVVTRKLSARRGDIYDSNGQLLATDVVRYSVFADPTEVEDRMVTARMLARVLNLDTDTLEEKLAKEDRLFVWIKRQVPDADAALVRQLNLPGVHLRRERKRIHPHGSMAAHMVGFTDIDGRGLAGLELELDSLLTGKPGKEIVSRDGKRRSILMPSQGVVEKPFDGCDVHLTIDSCIQAIVEEELKRAAERHEPEVGVAVALDPRTGAVLGMASWPGYNPAEPAESPIGHRKNRVITDVYEFGSVLKPITVAAALESNAVKPDTKFDCHQGAWRIGGRTVHDVHGYDTLTVREIIYNSSNIGAAQIGLKTGKKQLYRNLVDFGFGRPTGIHLPGEQAGILRPLSRWSEYSVVSISFGQEIATTPLSVARAFCAFANGGMLPKPSIISKVVDSHSGTTLYELTPQKHERRAISRQTARQVREMLALVVEEGTGKRAKLQDYRVGGKTGTAQLLREDGRGYSWSRHLASFAALAPVDDPRVVVLVSLKDPSKNGYYGGVAAAPACGRIIRRTLKYMKVPPRAPDPTTIAEAQR